jgi:ABC-type phosphate/phosphonate transport system substrate-binding protein
MASLTFTSCQAEIAEFICRDIAGYIAERLALRTEYIGGMPWQARERLLDAGQIDVAWICGAPYVWKVDRAAPRIELLAAPVMAAARYRQLPVYYSDVVVHAESGFHSFAGLHGAAWAYNEPRSHSGYHIVRYALAARAATAGYFGRVVESGAHQATLRLILDREVDTSAIDSTVLELAYQREPWLHERLRVVDTFGPSPIPPWVVGLHVAPELRQALRDLLLRMHADPQGRAILHAGQMARFVAVADRDYDPIRRMLKAGEGVKLVGH